MPFFYRSSKKEKEEEAGGPKKQLFTSPTKSVKPELPKPTLAQNNPPGPSTLTPFEMGTPRTTSSVESKRGPGRPHKELTMPRLADYQQNASKEELAH